MRTHRLVLSVRKILVESMFAATAQDQLVTKVRQLAQQVGQR